MGREVKQADVWKPRARRGRASIGMILAFLALSAWFALMPPVVSTAKASAEYSPFSSGLPVLHAPGATIFAEQPPDSSMQASFESEPMLAETLIADFTANAAFAVDITSGDLLYQYDADVRVAPASTLKIITALTALTVFEADDVVQIAFEDLVDTTVYSNAQLLEGDQVTVEDLLAGLMIPSGGDAAIALAREGGTRLGPGEGQTPVARFVDEMNHIAVRIGMTGSNFVNPDGPDHPEQYTTARDMAIAGAALLDDRLLSDIVSQERHEVTVIGPNARTYEILNTNALLGAERVHGIKTGTTGEAGESLVLATRRSGNQVVIVIMGSEDRYQDALSLLRYIDARVRWVEFGASSDFPGIQRAADRFNFILAVPQVRPMLNREADRLYANLTLGPRPRGTLPVRWGDVVFLHEGDELYRIPVLMANVEH